ncbi:SCO2400 family protein [Streptomyces corynorhini]|uniref:Uncharacterized protein n=1 Tax=Streptomyces corynorhini TaxID=2282652 RepID=A0A370B6H8_9ACTN|nr:hypothetical protein [Streptomyces corynorhini]RDG35989.1 hypothetical protein DVH02_22290 [Streptomyces corynorhini]
MDYCQPCRRHLNGALTCAGCGAPADVPPPVRAPETTVAYELTPPARETAHGPRRGRDAAPRPTGPSRRRGKRGRGRGIVIGTLGVALVAGALSLAGLAAESRGSDRASSVREDSVVDLDGGPGRTDGPATPDAPGPASGTGSASPSDPGPGAGGAATAPGGAGAARTPATPEASGPAAGAPATGAGAGAATDGDDPGAGPDHAPGAPATASTAPHTPDPGDGTAPGTTGGAGAGGTPAASPPPEHAPTPTPTPPPTPAPEPSTTCTPILWFCL